MNPCTPWSWQDGLLLHDNLIYILASHHGDSHDDLRLELVSQHYNTPLAEHFGVSKTLELLSRNYYFSGMKSYVKDYVSSCDLCARGKPPHYQKHGELVPLPVPRLPGKAYPVTSLLTSHSQRETIQYSFLSTD